MKILNPSPNPIRMGRNSIHKDRNTRDHNNLNNIMVCENVLFLKYNNNHHHSNNYYLCKCLRLPHNTPDLYNPDPLHIQVYHKHILKNHLVVSPMRQYIFHSCSSLFHFV